LRYRGAIKNMTNELEIEEIAEESDLLLFTIV